MNNTFNNTFYTRNGITSFYENKISDFFIFMGIMCFVFICLRFKWNNN